MESDRSGKTQATIFTRTQKKSTLEETENRIVARLYGRPSRAIPTYVKVKQHLYMPGQALRFSGV
jgi:hypothetical protein